MRRDAAGSRGCGALGAPPRDTHGQVTGTGGEAAPQFVEYRLCTSHCPPPAMYMPAHRECSGTTGTQYPREATRNGRRSPRLTLCPRSLNFHKSFA